MQLMPPTGRQLGRSEGVTVTSTGMLLNPSLSIQLGTRYLKGQLTSWDGDLSQTLAAYNAGPGRVRQWLAWVTFREPAEFIENSPFPEEGGYVPAVLPRAGIYLPLFEHPEP